MRVGRPASWRPFRRKRFDQLVKERMIHRSRRVFRRFAGEYIARRDTQRESFYEKRS